MDMPSKGLRQGDLVEVRSPSEILLTLDEKGELDGLPFMPEMVELCGQRFHVRRRVEKICDTLTYLGSRRMPETVLLDDNRCSGGAHGNCQAECLIYWKEAWLRRVSASTFQHQSDTDQNAKAALLERATSNARRDDGSGNVRYRCQATQALEASAPLSTAEPRQYLREYQTGNVSLTHFARVMSRAVVMQARKKLGLLPNPVLRGEGPSSPKTPICGLAPGERVRVRSPREIEATLNEQGRNRGLWFDREMLAFCGKEFRVRQHIRRLIDERTGELVEISSDCVSLEGAVCSGEYSTGRWFCPRAIYPYWREAWLERVATQA
jgi:hypothetical protein